MLGAEIHDGEKDCVYCDLFFSRCDSVRTLA